MHDVMAVRVGEGVRHFVRDLERIVHRQLRLALQPVAQRFALDERHDVIQRAGGIARIVDRQDVRVLQPRGKLDLAQETLAAERHRDLGAQRLQRDKPLVLDVARQIDQRHPSAAQLLIDDVAIGERGVQFCKGISHSDNDSCGGRGQRARAVVPRDRQRATAGRP